MSDKQHFYSNGKLLLTSEYLVLNGATALALPTKKGQSLTFEYSDNNVLNWTSFDCNEVIWFKASFNLSNFSFQIHFGSKSIATTLQNLLKQSQKINPNFLKNGGNVSTKLNFDRNWGLGSSSTLINNISNWAEINPYQLLWSCFKGSGYDIACTSSKNPILFTLSQNQPKIKPVKLNWDFTDHLFFVHLNRKQNTSESIDVFNKLNLKNEFKKTTQITLDLVNCNSLNHFENLLTEHEDYLSNILSTPSIKESLFKDFNGIVKSLGAWGGDFVLATGEEVFVKKYFGSKGYKTILPFSNMVL